MNKLNAFNTTYWNWYSPKNIKIFFRNIKFAYQRVVRGYSDWDVWDLNTTLLIYLPETLRYLANNTHSYPMEMTEEEWKQKLNQIADGFEHADEANNYYKNEYWDLYLKELNQKPGARDIEAFERYKKLRVEKDKINAQLRQADFEEAWAQLGSIFFDLWD